MKTVLMFALIVLVSCSRNSEKQLSPTLVHSPANARSFLSLAKDKQLFSKVSTNLDLSKITQIQGGQNVSIFMAAYKDDPNKIYAVNTLGNELLYVSRMTDEKNGSIGLMKNGEAIVIQFKDGLKVVTDITNDKFETRYAGKFHGGSGFCQREKGESFGACFRAESDEFCDSFVSCVAMATQPSVAIVIGLACSCNP